PCPTSLSNRLVCKGVNVKSFGVIARLLLIVAIVVTCLSLLAFGQSESGSSALEGTVKDPSGAVVPGATVVLKQSATGFERIVTTGSNGNLSASVLPVGTYEVTAKVQGFEEKPVTVVLTVGKTTPITITLALSGAQSKVTVSANPNSISTDSESVGATIS